MANITNQLPSSPPSFCDNLDVCYAKQAYSKLPRSKKIPHITAVALKIKEAGITSIKDQMNIAVEYAQKTGFLPAYKSIKKRLSSLEPRSSVSAALLPQVDNYGKLPLSKRTKHISNVVAQIYEQKKQNPNSSNTIITEILTSYALKTGYSVPRQSIHTRMRNDTISLQSKASPVSESRAGDPQVKGRPHKRKAASSQPSSSSSNTQIPTEVGSELSTPQHSASVPEGRRSETQEADRAPKRMAISPQSSSTSYSAASQPNDPNNQTADSFFEERWLTEKANYEAYAQENGIGLFRPDSTVQAGVSSQSFSAQRKERWLTEKANYEAYAQENDIGLYSSDPLALGSGADTAEIRRINALAAALAMPVFLT